MASLLMQAVYKLCARLMPVDATVVLLLDLGHRAVHPATGSCAELHIRELSAEEIDAGRDALGWKDHGFSKVALQAVALEGARCFAAFDGDTLIGYDFIATGQVAARHNRAGKGFRGLGVALPPSCRFLFKAWVHPARRSQGVQQRLLRCLSKRLHDEGVRHLVTTTDIGNAAALASFRTAGFEPQGHVIELALAGRSFWRILRPVPVGDDGPLRFNKPATVSQATHAH